MSDADKLREAIKQARSQSMLTIADPFGRGPGTAQIYISQESARLLADAAESTLPKTKMVEVWRVEWAEKARQHAAWWPYSETYWTATDANRQWDSLTKSGRFCDCIRVTGPHQQEIPA